MSSQRTIGVLGGMGPAATADFYARLIRHTPAQRDQDHVPVVIWADPTVPDRPAALAGSGPSPVPALRRGIEVLEQAGATVLAVPCNTVHPFLPEALGQRPGLRWVSMVQETVQAVVGGPPGPVGLLATPATLAHRVYHDEAERHGLTLLAPGAGAQEALGGLIAAVKTGAAPGSPELQAAYRAAVTDLAQQGCVCVVVACTEVSVVADVTAEALPVPVLDASTVLAVAALAAARDSG